MLCTMSRGICISFPYFLPILSLLACWLVALTSLFEKPVITFTHTRASRGTHATKLSTRTYTYTPHTDDWTSRETKPQQLDSPIKYARKNSDRWFMQKFFLAPDPLRSRALRAWHNQL